MRLALGVTGAIVFCAALCSGATAQTLAPPANTASSISAEDYGREIGGPTLITLHCKDEPAGAVFAEITRQANLQIHHVPEAVRPRDIEVQTRDADTKISIDLDQVPFWPALQQIVVRNKLRYISLGVGTPPEPRRVIPLEQLQGVAFAGGPFFIVAGTTYNHVYLTYRPDGQTVRHANASIRLVAYNDPKLNAEYELPGDPTEIAADDGGILKHQANSHQTSFYNCDHFENWGRASFILPDASEVRKARVSGNFRFVQSTGQASWTVNDVLHAHDVASPAPDSAARQPLVLNSVAPSENGFIVSLTLPPAKLPITSAGVDYLSNLNFFLRLRDDKGRELQFLREIPGDSLSGDRRTVRFEFTTARDFSMEKAGGPVQFELPLPADLREIVVPFHFEGLPVQ